MRDLGFLLTKNLDFAPHCKALANKAMSRTYNLFKTIRTNNPKLLLKAYKIYVRSIVENGTTVFYPYKNKDIKVIESVQNNFTRKLILRCTGLKYNLVPGWEERNNQLGLCSLKSRKDINDLMVLYKILTGRVSTDPTDTVSFSPSRTRNGGSRS